MELELGLAPPNTRHLVDGGAAGGCGSGSACGKRGFGEAFEEEEEEEEEKTTLPLFDDGSISSSSSSSGCRRRKKKPVVGWPPVSSARRACGGGGGARHVKVKKEGVAIGRKVDLSLHASYDELLSTLGRMFPRAATTTAQDEEEEITSARDHDHGCHRAAAGRVSVVTYEDADGDWMLVGDVPWDDFARSVKRLKILHSS